MKAVLIFESYLTKLWGDDCFVVGEQSSGDGEVGGVGTWGVFQVQTNSGVIRGGGEGERREN